MPRSIANKASIRRTVSSANGEITAGFAALAARILRQISYYEERPSGMDPACGLQDRSCVAVRVVKLAIAAIGIGLEDADVAGQMGLGMFAGAIARVIKHRPRRGPPAKRLVVAHIDPNSARVGLALGQDRHRVVVPAQPLGAQHMGLEEPEQGHRRDRAALQYAPSEGHDDHGLAFRSATSSAIRVFDSGSEGNSCWLKIILRSGAEIVGPSIPTTGSGYCGSTSKATTSPCRPPSTSRPSQPSNSRR